MRNVIAIRQNKTWIAVWNLPYLEAKEEALADRGHREVLSIEEGQLLTFVSKKHD